MATATMQKATTAMKRSGSKEGTVGETLPLSRSMRESRRSDDWRGETFARVRALIKEADPDIVEDVKWRKPSNAMRGVPVWEHAGLICTGETYKDRGEADLRQGRGVRWTLQACSTPASTAR